MSFSFPGFWAEPAARASMTGWPLFSRSPSAAEPGSQWHLAAGCALRRVSTADATPAAAGMAECPEKVALGRLSLGPGSWAGSRGMLWGAGGGTAQPCCPPAPGPDLQWGGKCDGCPPGIPLLLQPCPANLQVPLGNVCARGAIRALGALFPLEKLHWSVAASSSPHLLSPGWVVVNKQAGGPWVLFSWKANGFTPPPSTDTP